MLHGRRNAPSTPGTYYYGACVDAVTGESDTTNNCSGSVSVTVVEPQSQSYLDLGVGSPSVNESSPDTGESFTLSATVRNDDDAALLPVDRRGRLRPPTPRWARTQ